MRVLVLLTSLAAAAAAGSFDIAVFKNPPALYRGWAMWGLDLSKATEASVVAEVRDMAKKHHYGGLFIVAWGASGKSLDPAYVKQARPFFQLKDEGIEYLSPEFFKLYRAAVEEGRKQGLNVIFYDDYFYPTGTVCGQLYQKAPEHMAKRLEMVEQDVSGPEKVDLAIPAGTYIGAVLMNRDTFERVDVTGSRTADNRLQCGVPKGKWKAMAFYLDHDAALKIRNPGIMDYLDETAVDKFLELSYDKFYSELKEYYGPVIKMAFHDEPSMHWLDGQMWTPSFNRKFERKHGFDPVKLYPALWYDIGPETSAARNALYGLRAELFQAFLGKLDTWCARHGIQLTGHLDQEEVPNPVPINGDLMKMFDRQAVPGADDIFVWGRSNRGYKVVSSAAFNYDKPLVMTETYAAYKKVDEKILFQVAMDQFAMGVNFQTPTAGIEKKAKNVPDLNRYVGRLSYLLQGGRHVADIAILYPIASLQGCYRFKKFPPKPPSKEKLHDVEVTDSWLYAYNGGVLPPEIDYMDVAEALYRGLRVDFTYLHPEVFEGRCLIRKSTLVLDNKVNREEFKVLLVPGGDTLRAATAAKIRQFYGQGGTIVATSRLPFRSAEFGRDQEVRQAMSDVFGSIEAPQPVRQGAGGGRAYFVPKPDAQALEAVLREALPVRDVAIQEKMWPVKTGEAYDGALTYIHKVKDGRDIYFFANSSEKQVSTDVAVRGKKAPEIWNPHTGERGPAQYTPGGQATTVKLTLPPVSSVFYVQRAE